MANMLPAEAFGESTLNEIANLYGMDADSDESEDEASQDEDDYKVDDENENQEIDADDLRSFFNKRSRK